VNSLANIRISRVEKLTRVEGPGLRYAIWVQGCPIKCVGCFNPHTWDFNGGIDTDIDELYNDIKSIKLENNNLEGVTFLGGEPFSQAKQLSQLARKIRELNLSIVTFTGYEFENVKQSSNKYWHELLSNTDLLIDGPYKIEEHDLSRPWIGSKNQQYRFLTSKYKYLESEILTIPNKLEIRIHSNGTITANGMANLDDLHMLHDLGYKRMEEAK